MPPISPSGVLSIPRRIGPYVIGSPVDAGELGPTFEATRLEEGTRVALTFVPPTRTITAPEIFEFLQGFRKRFPLPHPGVALVGQVRPGGKHPFFVSSVLPAGTLAGWVRERPGRTEVVEAVRGLALAVDFLHGRGLARLPLSPESVLVAGDGRPRLHEFLLARAVYLRPRTGDEAEAASGRAAKAGYHVDDPLVIDLFALGYLLHLGLTGVAPAPAPDLQGLLALLDAGDLPSAGELDPTLAACCRRALALDPARRYPSAGALAEDLASWLHGRPSANLPANRPRPSLRRAGGAFGVAILALLVGLVLSRLGVLPEHESSTDPEEPAPDPFADLERLAGDPPPADPASAADPAGRARYGEGLRRLLGETGSRRIILFVESHLHEPYVAEETLLVFHDSLELASEAIRLALAEMTPDAFEALLAPLATGAEPTASHALEVVARLGVPRANGHLLSAIAARDDVDWTARIWKAYQAINGLGPTNRLRQDLEALDAGIAARAIERLESAGLWRE